MEDINPRMLAAIMAMMSQEQQAQTGNPSPGYYPEQVDSGNPMPPGQKPNPPSAPLIFAGGALPGAMMGGPVGGAIGGGLGALIAYLTHNAQLGPNSPYVKGKHAYNNEYGPGNKLP